MRKELDNLARTTIQYTVQYGDDLTEGKGRKINGGN